MKTINQLDIKNKTVIIRVDFNVPMKDGKITSNKRIIEALPTIKHAVEQNAKIILLSHLSRIKTPEDKPKKTLRPVADELSKLIKMPVIFCPETSGDVVVKAVKNLQPKQIMMLENTRYEDLNEKAESKNNPALGKFWASLGDVFINDAFGTSHRAHASNVGITSNIAKAGIGFLVENELKMLSKAVEHPEHPAIAIIGGSKVSDKIKVINRLAQNYDKVIIGGGMAYTFLKSQGLNIGKSLCEEDQLDTAKELLAKYKNKIILPIDNAQAKEFADVPPVYNEKSEPNIADEYMALDIGPKTIKKFTDELKGAKTVVWNGPLGVTEFSHYKQGTAAIAKAIAQLPDVYSIIGGGDSAAAIIDLGLEACFSHISTGGGASLSLLEGSVLPAIEAMRNK